MLFPSKFGFSDPAFFYRYWFPAKIRNRLSRYRIRAAESLSSQRHWGMDASRYFGIPLEEVTRRAATTTDQWEKFPRRKEGDYRSYYLETDHECYRQLWYHRHDAWYEILAVHRPNDQVLDYGCGVGAVASWLLRRRPKMKLTLADIPSQTLEFARWRLGNRVRFVEIGSSDKEFPGLGKFNIIICLEALNHMINPLDVVLYFYNHLEKGGYLFTDFTSHPGGVHLYESESQRLQAIQFLNSNLRPIRPLHSKSCEGAIYQRS